MCQYFGQISFFASFVQCLNVTVLASMYINIFNIQYNCGFFSVRLVERREILFEKSGWDIIFDVRYRLDLEKRFESNPFVYVKNKSISEFLCFHV